MEIEYKPVGVCPIKITYKIVDNKIYDLKYTGGCNGNLKAIGILLEGMDIDEVIKKLKGNTCGFKKTSCVDQLAISLEKYKEENK